MTTLLRISILVTLLSLHSRDTANAIIINPEVASAASYVSPDWDDFDQPYWSSPRSGDDGVDRAMRTYFVFNIGTSFAIGDSASINIMQTGATIDPLRPNGVPLIMKVFQANQLESLISANMATLWSATEVSSTPYIYPLSASSATFSSDISNALLLAAPSAVNPYVWVSIEILDSSSWFPAPNRNWVDFDQSSSAHNITIVPEPSAILLLIIAGIIFIRIMRTRRCTERLPAGTPDAGLVPRLASVTPAVRRR